MASAVLVVGLVIAVVSLRATRRLHELGAARRTGRARQLIFDAIDGQQPRSPRGPVRRAAVASTAIRLSTKLRGSDRAALAAWLTTVGFRRRATEMMTSTWPLHRARGARLFVACLSDRETGPLLDLLQDRDRRVRSVAARALGECGLDTAVPFLVRAAGSEARPLPVSVAAMAIVHTAPRHSRGLGMAWSSPDPTIVAMAAEVAGFLHLTDARPRIEGLLHAADAEVVGAAARALARLGDPRSAEAIAARLTDRALPPEVRAGLHAAFAELHDVRLEP